MIGTYDDLALEYYDAECHPTCANFHEASKILIKKWFYQFGIEASTILEVGAGKSVVAELLTEDNKPLLSLILLDSSPKMLEYSEDWIRRGAQRIIAYVDDMRIKPGSVTAVISSLGDAYNTDGFWSQVETVLVPNGIVIFTTPSYDWAASFRNPINPNSMTRAEFELIDGRHICVPSFIYPPKDQIALMRKFGLYIKEKENLPLSSLGNSKISSKLSVLQEHNGTVMTCYIAQKGII